MITAAQSTIQLQASPSDTTIDIQWRWNGFESGKGTRL